MIPPAGRCIEDTALNSVLVPPSLGTRIAQLDRRRAGRSGDKEHRQAVREQEEFEEQNRQEREQEVSE